MFEVRHSAMSGRPRPRRLAADSAPGVRQNAHRRRLTLRARRCRARSRVAEPVQASDPWGTAPRGGVPPQVLEMRREELHLGPLALEAA